MRKDSERILDELESIAEEIDSIMGLKKQVKPFIKRDPETENLRIN